MDESAGIDLEAELRFSAFVSAFSTCECSLPFSPVITSFSAVTLTTLPSSVLSPTSFSASAGDATSRVRLSVATAHMESNITQPFLVVGPMMVAPCSHLLVRQGSGTDLDENSSLASYPSTEGMPISH